MKSLLCRMLRVLFPGRFRLLGGWRMRSVRMNVPCPCGNGKCKRRMARDCYLLVGPNGFAHVVPLSKADRIQRLYRSAVN